jgi:hypothetical protein
LIKRERDDEFRCTNTIKIEDGDRAQKEHRKLRNAKRTECRHRIVEQHQQGQGDLYVSYMSDFRTIINVGRDAHNVIIA